MKFNSGNMKYSLIIAYNMYPYMPVKIFTLYFSEFFLMLFRDWRALRLKDLVRVPHGLRNSLDQSRCGTWGWGDRMCSLNCMSPSDPPYTLNLLNAVTFTYSSSCSLGPAHDLSGNKTQPFFFERINHVAQGRFRFGPNCAPSESVVIFHV